MLRIAINGVGRIGRAVLKIALQHPDIQVVAVNDLAAPDELAYLLRYDSVYGVWPTDIVATKNTLSIGHHNIHVFAEKDPKQLPWKDLGVHVVVECTGLFTDRAGAEQHLAAGAGAVIISAPTDDASVPTVLRGVSETNKLNDKGKVIANASCTTNSIAPVLRVLATAFGVEKSMMSTVHAYTATQELVDGASSSKKDFRRGRAAAINIVPSTTGAATAITQVFPEYAGLFDGVAVRVPVASGSLSDVVAVLKRDVSVAEVNAAFTKAANDPVYQGVLAVTSDPVVSSDVLRQPYSALVDLSLTRVVGGNLVKVFSWYDNEWGYATQLVAQVRDLAKHLS